MAITYEEWIELIKPAIENSGDSATVVSVLTDARDQYRELFAEKVAADEKAAALVEENKRLTDTNRELFLRIGQQMTVPETKVGETTRAETITVDDLFKED